MAVLPHGHMRASHRPIALAENTICTAESATVVMVILTACYMSDIGITNLCMYICSDPVTARWSIYIFG